jgi:hypothetical protein
LLRYIQGKTADAIARGEEPPWDALYTPPDMHNCLQRKTPDAIARGEKPPWGGRYAPGGLYAPPADPCIANPPTKKLPRKLNLRRHIARMAEVCHLYDVAILAWCNI